MINSVEMQSAYINLYKQMRKYVWGFRTVETLAELEIATYTTFPDMAVVRSKFNQLRLDIKKQIDEDEELAEAVEAFQKLIEVDEVYYAKLDKVREVVPE